MSLVPVQAHGERGRPRAVTCGSSRESDLHPESSFTGKYNVGQRGERGGVRCSLIHPPEKQESGGVGGGRLEAPVGEYQKATAVGTKPMAHEARVSVAAAVLCVRALI